MSAPAVTTRPHVVVVGAGSPASRGARGPRRAPLAPSRCSRAATGSAASSAVEDVAGHLVDVGAESMLALRPGGRRPGPAGRCGRRPRGPGDDVGLGLVARRAAPPAAGDPDGRADRPRLGPRHPHRRRGRAATARTALARWASSPTTCRSATTSRPASAPLSSTGSSSRCSAVSTPATPATVPAGHRCRCSGHARPGREPASPVPARARTASGAGGDAPVAPAAALHRSARWGRAAARARRRRGRAARGDAAHRGRGP